MNYFFFPVKTSLFHPDNSLLTDVLATYPGFKANTQAGSPEAHNMLKALRGTIPV